MRQIASFAILAALAAAGAACVASDPRAAAAAVEEKSLFGGPTHEPGFEYELAPGSLEGPTWRLVSLSGKEERAMATSPRGVTARFLSGRVEGFSGCNSYGGTYTIEGDRVTLGPLTGTMMACPEPAMALENAFKAAFVGTIRFAIAEDRLTVMTEAGGTLVFQAESPAALEGVTWEITGFNNGRRAVVSPILGTALTLSFRDGVAVGHSGCNTYRAGYTRDGNRLTIGAAAATRKACAAEGVMDQEQQFLAALQSASTWTIRGDVLDLQRADGARAVTARRGQTE
jgi:heat shock protein HslJ